MAIESHLGTLFDNNSLTTIYKTYVARMNMVIFDESIPMNATRISETIILRASKSLLELEFIMLCVRIISENST